MADRARIAETGHGMSDDRQPSGLDLAPTLLNLSALCEQRGDRAAARAYAVTV